MESTQQISTHPTAEPPPHRRRLPSPAMIVAIVALVFATTGVAGATGILPNPLPLQSSGTTVVYTASKEAGSGGPGSYASAIVLCGPGEHLVGGGGSAGDSGHFLWFSRPVVNATGTGPANGQPAYGWGASVSTADGSGGGTVYVYAVCEK